MSDNDKKTMDDLLVEDLDKLSKNEIMLNIKALIESYMSQATVAEKILIEFTKTRRIIELFLIEHLNRGGSIDDLSADIDMEQLKQFGKPQAEDVKKKTTVRLGETKFENGERF